MLDIYQTGQNRQAILPLRREISGCEGVKDAFILDNTKGLITVEHNYTLLRAVLVPYWRNMAIDVLSENRMIGIFVTPLDI